MASKPHASELPGHRRGAFRHDFASSLPWLASRDLHEPREGAELLRLRRRALRVSRLGAGLAGTGAPLGDRSGRVSQAVPGRKGSKGDRRDQPQLHAQPGRCRTHPADPSGCAPGCNSSRSAERAYANYLGRLRDGTEPNANPLEAIGGALRGEGPEWRAEIYLDLGRYPAWLGPYFQRFDRERIRIYLFEDFVPDSRAVLRDLFSFLGVNPEFVPDTEKVHNPTGRIEDPLIHFAWTSTRALRVRLGPRVPGPVRRAAWALLKRNLKRPPLPQALRAALVEYYRPDVLELETLIGRDLSTWLSAGHSSR